MNKGFSLIELIVVIGIIVIISSFGIANYTTFNQRQALKQASLNVENALRDAQNRAISGEKDCTACNNVGVCNDSNDHALVGWDFVILSTPNPYTRYRINGDCNPNEFGYVFYDLPPNVVFTNTIPGAGFIGFLPLGKRTTTSTTIRIKHTLLNQCVDIQVNQSGEFILTNIPSC